MYAPASFPWVRWKLRIRPKLHSATPRQGTSQRRFHGTLEAAAGAILHLAGKLPAGAIDLVPAGTADRSNQPGVLQYLLESAHPFGRRASIAGIRKRIERNQIELAWHITRELDQLARLLELVVDPVQHHIFEGNEVAWRSFTLPLALQRLGQRFIG